MLLKMELSEHFPLTVVGSLSFSSWVEKRRRKRILVCRPLVAKYLLFQRGRKKKKKNTHIYLCKQSVLH